MHGHFTLNILFTVQVLSVLNYKYRKNSKSDTGTFLTHPCSLPYSLPPKNKVTVGFHAECINPENEILTSKLYNLLLKA